MPVFPLDDELLTACVRCDEQPAADELGYCGHCHWISLLEVHCGLEELGAYLFNWALFSEWCDRNGRVAPGG